jgi:hypothetical protein
LLNELDRADKRENRLNTNTNRMDRVVVHGPTGLEPGGTASPRPAVAPAASVYAVTA